MSLYGSFGERIVQLVQGTSAPAYAKSGAELVRLVDLDGADVSLGGSLTPWTSDIDAAGFKLTNLNEIDFDSGGLLNTDQFVAASGLSQLYLTPDANFGIYNGEPAGSGADINLVSDNGRVVVPQAAVFDPNGAAIIGGPTAVPVAGTDSRAYFGSLVLEGYWPSVKFNIYYDSNSGQQVYINDGMACGMFQNQAGNYGLIFTSPVASAGDYVGAFQSSIVLFPSGNVVAGGSTGDGGVAEDLTGAFLQSFGDTSTANDYWARGVRGATGTMADGSTVTGGLITHIGP